MTSTEIGYYEQSYPPSIFVPPGPPDPTITSLVPATGSAAAGPLTVQVNGTLFEAGSVVEVDQVAVTTVFVSATELTATFDPSVAGTVAFTVRNPNNEESNSAPFIVGTLVAADVSALTVEAVQQFIRDNPELLAEVYALEQAGKARATLLAWLKTLLDEEAAAAQT
jgi:IPT/TIG domain